MMKVIESTAPPWVTEQVEITVTVDRQPPDSGQWTDYLNVTLARDLRCRKYVTISAHTWRMDRGQAGKSAMSGTVTFRGTRKAGALL